MNKRVTRPLVGDLDIETTYAAVGRAMSRWERIETGLASLHSIFLGRMGDIEVIRRLGQDNRIFAMRIKAVRASAQAYFIRYCSQDSEGRFDQLARQAETLSDIRNNFAHGIVEQILYRLELTTARAPAHSVTLHALGAPWYTSGRLQMIEGFKMGSYEIDLQSMRFEVLAHEIHQFSAKLVGTNGCRRRDHYGR